MDTDRYCDWLVVFTAFMCHCMTHGIVYSYGILFVSLRDAFHGSKSELGWIVSLTTGCLYLSGPLASVLVNRFGNRTVATVGAVISSFAYILTIFSTSLYFMYFSLGFLSGVGYGLIFIPCVVDVTKRFQKYRALACGTAVSGAGFGAFVVSPLIKVLLDAYSWRGTLLIQAAILLNVIPCAMSFTGRSTVSTNINKMTSKHSEKGEYKKVATEFADIEPDENDKSKIDTHSCKVINADVDGSTEVNDRYNIQTYRKYNEDNDGVINSDKCIYNTIATDTGSLKSYADENCGITQMSDLNAQTGFKNSTSSINKEIPKDSNNSVIEDKSKIDIEIEDESSVMYTCAHLQSEEINPAAKTLLHSSSIEMSSGKNLLSKFCSSLKFFGLLKRKEMLLFYTSQVLFISGLYLPFVFIPEMAISVGISRQSAAWIISTIGISTVFGRITLGYLSDRKFMNSCTVISDICRTC
ncbi:solute carrier 16 [Mactra antiquata]